MKIPWFAFVLLASTVAGSRAQVAGTSAQATVNLAGADLPAPTPYTVVSRDAHSRVWERTVYERGPSDQVIPNIHRYVETATGLNYKDSISDQWVESKEEIAVLPRGGATAAQGQHQAKFPGDIAQGVIELVTPDGKQLQSRPVGLSYDDGVSTVLIAELKDSAGYVVGANQVIYPDAFTGFKADVRCIYTKAGFEADIILREQPPTPESFGLNPASARLQVLTEFFNPPQPVMTTTALPAQAGISMTDENLDFGVMKMAPGRAFLIGDETNSSAGNALVGKQWVEMGGRQILVEEVPVAALANRLATLPVAQTAAVKPGGHSVLHVVSAKRLLPAQRLAKTVPGIQPMQMARAAAPARGLVLDYQTLNSSQTNWTFQGDTTYYISGTVNLYGTNTFEGGAVIKYTNNASINLQSTNLDWRAGAYRPVVFTARNDNSVGETISGSTGNPTNYYANPALSFPINFSLTLTNFRVAFAYQAFSAGNGSTITFFDSQVVNCQQGLTFGSCTLYLRNVLFSNVKTNFNYTDAASVYLQNCTFDTSVYLLTIATNSTDCTLTADNSILANVTNLYAWLPTNHTFTGSYNGFYSSPSFGTSQSTNTLYPFQSVVIGNYYLASGCSFTNAGTTNIDSTLLAGIRTKTTCPPIVYSNTNISVATTFSPQARRDTNDRPDLGYHYDPLDYIVSNVTVSASLTLTNGVALGLMGSSASLTLQTNGNLFSQGTPLNLNHVAHCANVQEQPVNVGNGGLAQSSSSSGNNARFRFSDLSMRPGGIVATFGQFSGVAFSCQDSQLRGCYFVNVYVSGNRSITFTNNLLERCRWMSASASGLFAAFYNNLFRGGLFQLCAGSAAVPWYVRDNLFDRTDLTGSSVGTNYIICSNNGFTTGTTNSLGGTSNKTGLVADYQAGPLGRFYYPANGGNLSQLINAGSRSAASAGLYHFTTQTNQEKETNSVVDIGYHYVAVDTNGIPLDSNGDGIPDYLEDANGNGSVDSGETAWMPSPTITIQPTNQNAILNSNASFVVTATSLVPMSFQWLFNGTNLIGATNASLLLYSVQTNDAGSYVVVVTNPAGSTTSSNAALTIMSWTVDSDYDGISDAQEIIDGTDPFDPGSVLPVHLGYWRFDDTNTWVGNDGQLPLLATNVLGVPSWNTNAVLIDSTNPAILCYRDVETNGEANINLRCGTIRFWFKPDWSSGDQGGTGPQSMGRLIEMGDYHPEFTNGWWALYLSPDGTQLTFGLSTNGAGNANLSASISWAYKRWHQIALTYSPTNATLYCDGEQIATDETNPNYYPGPTERTNGFRIGSDASGGNQADGVFEDLETFNYQLSATDIADDYESATNSMTAPPTVTITHPIDYSINLLGTNQALTIEVDAQAAPGQSIQEVDYSYIPSGGGNIGLNNLSAVMVDPPIGTATQWPFSFAWLDPGWTNAFVGIFDITAIAVDDLGVASNPDTVHSIAIASDFDSDGIPGWWLQQYFGHPDGETGDHSLAGDDADGDGFSNLQEYQNDTDPTDFYNGESPGLKILSGKDQAGNYDSFLPLPLLVQVTGVDSISNAPITFVVTNGTALLATATNSVLTNTLSLQTDSNGLAAVWVYFPPAGSSPPSCVIQARTGRGIYFDAVTTNIEEYVALARWHFDDTNTWAGEAGQLPLLTNNLIGIPSWSSNAVLIDSASPALLAYRVVEDNGSTNINCQTGSVLFYFKPNWSSVDQGGTGPGTSGRLIEAGSYSPDFANGWWSLYLNPEGTQLLFATATDGNGMINLTATISWASNEWHQIALAYSPTGSALFVDGQPVATGGGVSYFPNADELADGFRIGSDENGNNQAGGAFDELETFASPLSGGIAPAETFWLGIPDYQADPNAILGAWLMAYFGHLGVDPYADYDDDGTNNLQEYQNGSDPNKISFSFSVPNQYVATNLVDGVITILGGAPSYYAVRVDNTNFPEANWIPYTSSNITVDIGTTPGAHDVWIGLRGLPANAQQTWEETTLILNSVEPTITITSPADSATFNSSRVNVSGNFTAAALKQITVNGISAFVNGTNFEARNVPLNGGANIITAVIEDFTGTTNAASIIVTGTTNTDGSLNDPVQLQATPVAGFAPLSVGFQITSNSAPGTIQQVLYDFNGDDMTDFATNNLDSITYTYETNGEYFPVVTIQTDTGSFSSIGGWNGVSLDSTNQPVRINVQAPATQSTLTNVPNPVDLKWDGTHLYVLSGSGSAIYEFATNGNTIRSLGGIGTNPSGIDVDGAGNVYVAVTASNQVWKFNPTVVSFQADTNFGIGGCIGLTNGASGSNNGEFNAPFDVAVSPDGGTFSVSDTGNNRIQQFTTTSGAFIASFGSQGSDVGQFNAPKGLTYDSSGTLYIVDSGSNRIVMAQGSAVMDATGTGGTDLGQFSGALNISVGKRGVYVADTGNNRIQKFDLPAQGLFEITPGNVSYALSTGLSLPAAVAAVDDLTNEMFYVADTGNNRVILCHLPDSNADTILAVWNSMTNCVAHGDISGAAQFFCSKTADGYQQAFFCIGSSKVISDINDIGPLTPAYIENDLAQYYFEQTVGGQTFLFPVQFVRENGTWKIFEF
jgi:sugar lactone lactonase YvrE